MAKANGSPSGADNSEPVGEHVRIYRRGKTWHCTYQVNKRQHRKSLKTTNKKLALRKAAKIDVEISAGVHETRTKVATVKQAIDDYKTMLKSEGRAPKTLTKYTHVLKRVQELADLRCVKDLSGLDLSFLDAYRKLRNDEGAAIKTRYGESVILRQLILFALSRKMLGADPMPGLKMPKPKPTRQPCWKLEEVAAILAAASSSVQPALTLLAETGMRFGELAWLTWDDVDFGVNVIKIQPKAGWKPKTGDIRGDPSEPRSS